MSACKISNNKKKTCVEMSPRIYVLFVTKNSVTNDKTKYDSEENGKGFYRINLNAIGLSRS